MLFSPASPRVSAGQQGVPAASPDKKTEEVFKNIQVLKGLPSTGLMRAMGFFRRSLGVECTFCHVPPTFEKDDKPTKLMARKMYLMVQSAQKELGTNKVSCFMCHRGHEEPEPAPFKAEIAKAMQEAAKDPTPAEKVYSNIQVLKGMPAGDIMVLMGAFTRSLGVECTHCHVEGEFEKDDKPAKQTARKMIQGMMSINKQLGKTTGDVNCFTCHRGEKEPVAFPPQQAPAEKKF